MRRLRTVRAISLELDVVVWNHSYGLLMVLPSCLPLLHVVHLKVAVLDLSRRHLMRIVCQVLLLNAARLGSLAWHNLIDNALVPVQGTINA